ncbi:helix-turn-helix domain-containing protein [Nitrincola sp.]|uniref:helix-turn-helix domain-containing protein n=1 Tax=Nitrincola sp. TaxID=1926584 RepID=UPI003A8E7628
MIEKGNKPAEYVGLLLAETRKIRGSETVRAAVREYLIEGGKQTEIASRYGVDQRSLSRLIGKLLENGIKAQTNDLF